MALELSIVIPTYNEIENLPVLFDRLRDTLKDIEWEVIVVDDNSPDGTYDFAKKVSLADYRIRCIRRLNRRGLAGACIEGALSSAAPFIAVMDADMQHDETILPLMLQRLRSGEVDLVVGSRYADNGTASAGFSQLRAKLSAMATAAARIALGVKFKDLMSGFFMLRREAFERVASDLSPEGFKVLLDIVVTSDPGLRVEEIGYSFRTRIKGESKLDAIVAFDFLGLLLNKVTKGYFPTRFAAFAFVGLIGVFVHLCVFYFLFFVVSIDFIFAQMAATWAAMTSNFFINNVVTYRDVRLHGTQLILGLFSFYLVCSVGAFANVSVATLIFQHFPHGLVASVVGVVMGSVWNYALSNFYVWNDRS